MIIEKKLTKPQQLTKAGKMKTIVFDLNGTLSKSNEPIDSETGSLLKSLLSTYIVAIVSGASWKQMQYQVLDQLDIDRPEINNLYLLPTSGGSMYQVWGKYGWVAAYQNKFDRRDTVKIVKVLEDMVNDYELERPKSAWGKQIDCRECQVTFSALGPKAPVDIKEHWDFDNSKRKALVSSLQPKLQGYDIFISGKTSIDICPGGINKKFGVDELMKRLHISKDDVVYVGNSIFRGGNDYAAVEMGLEYVQVQNPEHTKNWIRGL